ncbi:MAG: hypothetical protein PHN84_15830 [Desulfuromonadaceae bacterium]|nr:hypothetical protein [Desulfuromonadaceae bacterium]MDD2856605.1 hypothetical protein [Desulfuromonadaceae bacterium]
MSRLGIRLERLEKGANIHHRDTPLLDPAISEKEKLEWLESQSYRDYLQAIRVKLDLPDLMEDMDVILNHSFEITTFLLDLVDGKTKDLVTVK